MEKLLVSSVREKVGTITCRFLHGFGCRVLAHDVVENIHVRELGDTFVSMNELLSVSDIITTLHAPLTPATRHAIIDSAIVPMKQGVMFINTSRGAFVDTRAVIYGLKSGRIGVL